MMNMLPEEMVTMFQKHDGHNSRELEQQDDDTAIIDHRIMMMEVTIVFTLASFIANCGQAVTGFGMAMIFWFVFTIGDFVGLLNTCSNTVDNICGVKEAAFIQALSLASVSPLLLWNCRHIIKRHANKALLTAFIPATIIGTPIGQLLQRYVNESVVRLVVGVSILMVSTFDVLRLIKNNRKTTTTTSTSSPSLNTDEQEDSSSVVLVDDDANLPSNKTENTHQERSSFGFAVKESSDQEAPAAEEEVYDITLVGEEAQDDDDEEASHQLEDIASSVSALDNDNDDDDASSHNNEDEFIPNHVGGYKFWILGFVLGFISGLLGGLSGLRSGPILIFFLHFDYPKPIIRANLMIVTCVNTYVRIVYYIVEDFTTTGTTTTTDDDHDDDDQVITWFDKDVWYLYVCVIVAGILGVPLGTWIEPKINQSKYNAIIVMALMIAGIMNTTKGSIDISKSN